MAAALIAQALEALPCGQLALVVDTLDVLVAPAGGDFVTALFEALLEFTERLPIVGEGSFVADSAALAADWD